MNAAGKGNCDEEESRPLMLIEAEAVVNVSFMYYNPLFRIQLTDTLHFAPGGGGVEDSTWSTNSFTRSRMGSGPSLVFADGGRWRSSFWRESATVLAYR